MKLLGCLMGTCVVVLLFISACSPTVPKGRVQFDLNTRKQLYHSIAKKEFLDGLVDTLVRDMYFESNLYIYNLLTYKNIPDTTHVSRMYDIYALHWFGSPAYIVYTNGNRFTVGDLGSLDYEEIVGMVVKYFKKNPNIDRRLLPLWLQRTTYLWAVNHMHYDQYGPWYDFYHRQMYTQGDSLMMEYLPYYTPAGFSGVIDAPADSTAKCN